MLFFLGTHIEGWVSDERFENVPLFISKRRLDSRRTMPAAVTSFAMDSGGFTELQMFGTWKTSAEDYAAQVSRYALFYRERLKWVAPQDWMCEPIVLTGGIGAMGVRFVGTGLTVEEHQSRTVANFLILRRKLRGLVIPVLQGWSMADYSRCQDMYKNAGVMLENEPTVGVGSVCRRQSSAEATTIMTTLAADGLNLPGFGFKKGGLKNCHNIMTSADSMAWSSTARQGPILLDGHGSPGPRRTRGHINCANCADYALIWRNELLEAVKNAN